MNIGISNATLFILSNTINRLGDSIDLFVNNKIKKIKVNNLVLQEIEKILEILISGTTINELEKYEGSNICKNF